MFDWLYEGRQVVYLSLAGLAVVVLCLWARQRFALWQQRPDRTKPKGFARRLNPQPAILAGLCVVGLGYFVLDRLVETRSEQIERKLHEMAGAIRTRDMNRIFRHISAEFRHEGHDRDSFRRAVEVSLRSNLVAEVTVWDVKFLDDRGRVELQAKPKGGRLLRDTNVFFLVHADFVRDPDGQWRMRGFTIFNPYVNTQEPLSILPYLGR